MHRGDHGVADHDPPPGRCRAARLGQLLRGRGAALTARTGVILGDEAFLRKTASEEDLVTPRDSRGWLLRLAVDFGRPDILKLLLDLGLDPDARVRVSGAALLPTVDAGADVVTTDGRLIHTNKNHHPELLWALKGGGGNFGVVTAMEFQAHHIGTEVWLALVFYPASDTQKVLREFRKYQQTWPDELNGIAILWNAPTEEPIPEEYRGKPVCILAACYCGDVEKGEDRLKKQSGKKRNMS